MKKVFLISLVLNLALVGVIAYGWKARQAVPLSTVPVAPEQAVEERAPLIPGKKSSPELAEARTEKPAAPLQSFSWNDVESPDYKIYIENLRRIRCPESTIIDIIIADVSKFYRNKLAPLRKESDTTFKFWEMNGWSAQQDPDYQKAWQQIEKEKSKLLKDLLGSRYAEEIAKYSEWQVESPDPFYKNLPEDKKERMAEIQEKFNEMKQEVYRRTRGGMQDDEDRADLKKIEREQAEEMAKILSPEELFEYRLRHSDVVQNMRWELEEFDATEEEFRAVAQSRFAMEELESGDKKLSHEDRGKLVRESQENLKKVLGEERYKELQLSSDWEYRNLKKIVEKNGGDKQITQQIYGMKDDIQRAISTLRNDKSLTKEERDQKVLAIRTELEKTLTEVLGERGFKAFKRHAHWLRSLDR